MACLYMITAPSGKSYIGYSSRSAQSRFSEHVANALACRTSSVLHASIRKYGPDKMRVREIVVGDEDYCFDLEHSAILAFGTMIPHGYNMIGGGAGLKAMPKSVRVRRAATLKKTMAKPEFKEKQSKMLASRYANTDSAQKISRSLREFYSRPENRLKAIAALELIRNDPAIQAKRIAAIKIAAQDKEAQIRRIAASTATNRTKERRDQKRIASAKMWQTEGHAAKVRASFDKRFEEGLTRQAYIYPVASGSFSVKFRRCGVKFHVGTFKTQDEAIHARDKKLAEIKAREHE